MDLERGSATELQRGSTAPFPQIHRLANGRLAMMAIIGMFFQETEFLHLFFARCMTDDVINL